MPRNDPAYIPEQTTENIPRRVTHIVIPIEIWECDIPVTAKILFAEIWSLQDPVRGCFASNAYFAKFLHVTEIRVSQLLRELDEKGLIEYRNNKHNAREKRCLTIKENFNAALKQILSRYIDSKESIKKNYIKPNGAEKPRAGLSDKNTRLSPAKLRADSRRKTPDPVINHIAEYFKQEFQSSIGNTPTLTPRDYKAVKDQLKAGRSREELQQLIDWCLDHKKDYPGKTGRLDLFMSAHSAWRVATSKTTASAKNDKYAHLTKTCHV